MKPHRRLAALLFLLAGSCVGAVEPADPSVAGTSPAAPGEVPEVAEGCKPLPARVWKLTPAQYSRTVQAILGDSVAGAGDALTDTLPPKKRFTNSDESLDVSVEHTDALLGSAQKLAAAVVADAKIFPCQVAKGLGQQTITCVRKFLQGFTAKAYRRDAEIQAPDIYPYLAFMQAQNTLYGDPVLATRLMMTAVLLSPQFLFRTELGADAAAVPGSTITLTPFETAQALSYFLTDGPPDDALYAAARAAELQTKAQIAAHGKRLLASAKTGAGAIRFLGEMLGTGRIATVVKDPKLLPDWSPELGLDLAKEADLFVQEVLWNGDRKVSTLLGADFSIVNSRVGALYGISGGSPTEFRRVSLPPTRAGILTSGALLAYPTRGTDTAPVQRGKFIRTSVLCQNLPPPPDANKATPIPADGKRTQRERLAQHSVAECASCHSLMDPLGLALENYDALGKYRTVDVGQNIDASGKLIDVTPEGAAYTDGVGLARLLARSPEAAACLGTRAAEYAVGRSGEEVGACFAQVRQSIEASGGDIIDLLLAVATDGAFRARLVPQE